MKPPSQIDAAAKSVFRKQRRQRLKMHQGFETIAALTPAIIFMLHLAFQAASVTPSEQRNEHSFILTNAPNSLNSLPVAIVPEPNATVLAVVGFATLCYWRRKTKAALLAPGVILDVQPSKMAIAVA